MTGGDLRGATIGRPSWGKRGYRTEDVDAFLVLAAEALDAVVPGHRPGLSTADVRDVVFRKPPLRGGRGYDQDEVDDLLDAVAAALPDASTPARPIEPDGRPFEP